MQMYQDYLKSTKKSLNSKNDSRFASLQLIRMHCEAQKRKNPLIVELGVNKGQSTKIFLNAINKKKSSRLVSVDIKNCSDAANSKKWLFIQQDSSDIKGIIKKAPIILKGIDILYIDSLHTAEHVKKEIYNFFRYLNKGAVVFFDDIDSGPYMQNQRKDSYGTEIANRKIFKLIESIFRSNHDKIDFEIMRGSTGLGIFYKRVKLGEKLRPPLYLRERNNFYISKFKNFFKFKQ